MAKYSPDLGAIADEIDMVGLRRWFINELTIAFGEARKRKLKTFNEHQYEINWSENIVKLADAVLEHHYAPSSSISFVIYEPMIREIFAAPFVDRIIHHFVYRLQADWWDRRFIYDSYSCRDDKGTLFGIHRVHKMMRQATNNFSTEAYIIKLDIKGYFMSLPRPQLYWRVRWGLKRQFDGYWNRPAAHSLYHLCDYLWRKILLDDPIQKSRRRGPLSNWNNLPPEKSLYTRDPGEGIVIGNLTSQLVSNIYLDQLDRFVKYDLGYQYYGRYVDDFFIIVPKSDYQKALRDVKAIEEFLRVELGLVLHPKKRYIQSVYKGVNFLGARIYPHCLCPSNRLQAKFRRAAREFIQSGGANYDTFVSYLGLLRHLDANKFVKSVFDEYGLNFNLYLETKATDRRSFQDILEDLRGDWHN